MHPEPQPLNPYCHELNPEGTACAEDCTACRWVERTKDAPWKKRKPLSEPGNLQKSCARTPWDASLGIPMMCSIAQPVPITIQLDRMKKYPRISSSAH